MTLSGYAEQDTKEFMLELRVLIPLLVDDPLWEKIRLCYHCFGYCVLIPLLVDDPLWVFKPQKKVMKSIMCLNPSFSG